MSLLLEPDAPTDIHFTNVTEDSAVMLWFAPRAKITGYRLFLTVEGSNPKQLRLPARLTQYTLLNLKPDTVYTATIHSEQENTLSQGESAVFTTSKCHIQMSYSSVVTAHILKGCLCFWNLFSCPV